MDLVRDMTTVYEERDRKGSPGAELGRNYRVSEKMARAREIAEAAARP